MPHYKVTYFFESDQQGEYGTGASIGWTESWYTQSTGSSLDQVYLQGDFSQYLDLRLAFMPDVYRTSFLRLSQAENPRVFKVFTLGTSRKGQVVPSPGDRGSFSLQVQCAILIDMMRMPTEPFEKSHHKRFLVRGLPAGLVNGNVFDTTTQYWPRLSAFLNFVGGHNASVGAGPQGSPWHGLRFFPPAAARINVTNVRADTSDKRLIQVQPDIPGLVPGNFVQIQGMVSPHKSLNRVWTLTDRVPGPPVWMILGIAKGAVADQPAQVLFTGPGNVRERPIVYGYDKFDQWSLIGVRSRKTGRVFHQLRGRSTPRI